MDLDLSKINNIGIDELSGNEKYTKKQISIINCLNSSLKEKYINDLLKDIIPVDLWFQSLAVEGKNKILNYHAENSIWIALQKIDSVNNSKDNYILVEVELNFIHNIIAFLLNYELKETRLRPLTPAEEGIVFYIINKLLCKINSDSDSYLKYVGIFDKFPSILFNETYSMINVFFKTNLELTAGQIIVHIPENLIQYSNLLINNSLDIKKVDSNLKVKLPIKIGQTALSVEIVRNIEVGDIVTIDKHQVNIENINKLDGSVSILVNELNISAKLYKDNDRYLLEVISIGENIMEENIIQNQEQFLQSEIEKLPIKVDIILGDFETNVKELLNISSGKIIPLGITLPPLVKLVHNNQVIARGQLVEIEGELGVKIVKSNSEEKNDK